MSSKNTSNEHLEKVRKEAIENAAHGDFFFAKWTTSDGYIRKSPCFILSDHEDPYNEIIVLKCTSKPARTPFDVSVKLKRPSVIRTNKIYTIKRQQLLFPIHMEQESDVYNQIIDKLTKALKINQ